MEAQDYKQLVKALRCETEDMECDGCKYYKDYFCNVRSMQHDAAAAIEELENALADECKECDYLVDENARLTTENKELQAENKKLRGRVEDEELKIDFLTADNTNYEIAIEELKAQLPKRGEWVEDTTTYYAGPGLSNYKCSLCGKICGTWRRGLKPSELPNWCGNCGADMRNMEVQK